MGEEGRRWRGERHIPSSEQLITKTGDHLTWQRAPPATQLTREENSCAREENRSPEIGNRARGRRNRAREGGIARGIVRGREETRARQT
jgi:hypothetical protein